MTSSLTTLVILVLFLFKYIATYCYATFFFKGRCSRLLSIAISWFGLLLSIYLLNIFKLPFISSFIFSFIRYKHSSTYSPFFIIIFFLFFLLYLVHLLLMYTFLLLLLLLFLLILIFILFFY